MEPINEITPRQSSESTPVPESSPVLIITRASVFAGLCRLVPLPFVDDWLVKQANRHLVGSMLDYMDTGQRASVFSPIYSGTGNCFFNALWFILIFPFKLVFKLIVKAFKTVLFFLLIRDAALQMIRTLMMGLMLERCLKDGRLSWETPEITRNRAIIFEKAAAKAFRGTDWQVVRLLFFRMLRQFQAVGELAVQVMGLFRSKAKSNQTVEEDFDSLSGKQKTFFESITSQIMSLMGQPEMIAYVEEFEQRFDREWATLEKESG